MTTCLYSFLTAGADRMAQVDPHGWTLTMISVCVVFCALIILFFIYTLSGKIFSGKFKLGAKKKVAGDEADDAVAAAITLAIDAETGRGDEAAAIALALHLHLNGGVHDIEPGIITICHKPSGWDDKQRNFRKSIQK